MAIDTIELQFSTDEINLILEGLGNLPFVKVYALIGKIQQQAGSQLNRAPDRPNAALGVDNDG